MVHQPKLVVSECSPRIVDRDGAVGLTAVTAIIFGYLLSWSGLWTTCWMFLAGFVMVCLVWMHMVVQRMMKKRAPGLVDQIEDWGDPNNAESAI